MAGTYVGFLVDTRSEAFLRLWISAQLGFPEPKHPLHATTVYSREEIQYREVNLPHKAYKASKGSHCLVIFQHQKDPEKFDLVLGVNCNALFYSHSEGVRLGAVWDFPNYIPHITIARLPIERLVGQELTLPPFDVWFQKERILPVDEHGRVLWE